MIKLFSLRRLKQAALLAAIALAPAGASALSVSFGDVRTIEKGTGTISAAGVTGPASFGYVFGNVEPGGAARYYQQFSVEEAFDLVLDAYTAPGGAKALLLPGLVLGGGSNIALETAVLTSDAAGTTLFASLAPGEYTLFTAQFGEASVGSALYSVVGIAAPLRVAAVPLPLSLVLLASALGGLTILRRRTSA
ncbi:MAG: hypothetical protein V2I33_21560 [Kangiellaceae bacterium]|nr:hypothetical protein [Kangiellaceae bacterium]